MEKCFDLLNGASVQKQELGLLFFPSKSDREVCESVCLGEREKDTILVYSIPPLSCKSTGSPGP